MVEVQEILTCPECKNSLISESHLGQTTCTTCGLVVQEREVDTNHYDVRTYNRKDVVDKFHNGDPVGVFSLDLSTIIPYKKMGTNRIKNQSKWINIIKINNWKFSNSKTSLFNGSMEIKRLKSILDLPYPTIEMAMLLYRKAYKADLIRGRSINGIIDACIYYACRKQQIPISYLEIIKANDLDHHLFFRCYYALSKEFNLNPGILFPKTFISRYCSMFGLPMKCEKEAMRIVDLLSDQYIVGKDPKGIIGGLLYLICKKYDLYCNQVKFAKEIGVSEVTLRNRYHELKEFYKGK